MTPFEQILLDHEANSSAPLQIKKSLSSHLHSCNTTLYDANGVKEDVYMEDAILDFFYARMLL
ncbi:hypothetical protein KSC_105100 [Ktedonobacter sp. SOSP1-52]|nr:hypothetical protein KSC_105100 [Ktedonobacter sp. SOSP1-52]